MESVSGVGVTSSENYLREVVFMLSVRKELIFFVSAIIFGLILAIALFWPARYTTTAKILISTNIVKTSLGTLEQVDYRMEKVSKEDLNSEAQLLLSNDLISQVILQLKKENKLFFDTEIDNQETWLSKQILRVKKAVVVNAIPYSKVLDISLVWSDAQEAKILLDRLLTHYLSYRIKMEGYSGKNRFFDELSNEYLSRIETANQKISDVMQTKKVVSPEAEITNNLAIKFSLEKVLGEGELKKISLDKRIELLEEKMQEKEIQFFSFLQNESITQFSKQIQVLFIQKAKTEGVFISDSKAVRGMEMQLEAAYHNLLIEVGALKSELIAQAAVLSAQKNLLLAKISSIDKRNSELKMAMLSMESLQNVNKVLQMSFEIFFKRKEEAALASSSVINGANVSILSSPKTPLSPSFPNKRVMIPFGFIVACLSGLITGFLVEFFDHTFKRPEDINPVLSMKFLISISDS